MRLLSTYVYKLWLGSMGDELWGLWGSEAKAFVQSVVALELQDNRMQTKQGLMSTGAMSLLTLRLGCMQQ